MRDSRCRMREDGVMKQGSSPGHRPMGLNNTPVTVAMLIHFGAIPPHLGFAGIRDVIEGQNGCLAADLDLGALTSIKKAEG